jgi:hypothetical protein
LQDWHVSVHAALQHTPSAQKLDMQSSFEVHAVPLAEGM